MQTTDDFINAEILQKLANDIATHLARLAAGEDITIKTPSLFPGLTEEPMEWSLVTVLEQTEQVATLMMKVLLFGRMLGTVSVSIFSDGTITLGHLQ